MTSIPATVGRASGVMLVMMAAGLWATVGVAVQMTPEVAGISDTVLAAARMGIGGIALLAVWVFALAGRLAVLRRLNLRSLAVFAVAAAAFQTCLFRSFEELGVTVAVCLTVCLPPVLGVAWAGCRGGRVSRTAVLALVVALAGMGLVAAGGGGADQAGMGLTGLVYGCVASVAFVVMSLVAADMARSAPAIVVAGAGLALSALLLGALVLVTGSEGGRVPEVGAVTLPVLGLIVYLGLLPTALAYLCYCRGMARCRTPAVGLVASMVEPVLAAGLAALLLGEAIAGLTGAGCLLLMGAMGMLWCDER